MTSTLMTLNRQQKGYKFVTVDSFSLAWVIKIVTVIHYYYTTTITTTTGPTNTAAAATHTTTTTV